jgi:hypothetical protein
LIASAAITITRRESDQGEAGQELVLEGLDQRSPVGDRLVGKVEKGDRADIGIGPRPKAQALQMSAQPDIHREDPELAEHLHETGLGGERKGDGQEIDARPARKVDELGNRPKLAIAADHGRRAVIVAIVEHADDLDVGSRALQRFHQATGRLAATNQDAAAKQLAIVFQSSQEPSRREAVEDCHRKAARQP